MATYARERYNATARPSYTADDLRAEFKRVQQGIPYPAITADGRDFGLAGNGVTDDITRLRTVVDQTAAAASSNGGMTVLAPGTYKISGNPFYNRIGQGNCTTMLVLNGAKLLTSKQVKIPASTVIRGLNRLRCGIFADTTYIASAVISTIVRASNVVTVTTSTAHGLESNATVQISGVTDTSFNGGWILSSVPTTTSFTFAQTAANASDSTGTVYIPLVVLGDQATNTQGVRVENLEIHGGDITDSIGIYSNAMGEECGGSDFLLTNVAKYGIWLERAGTSLSTGGPNNYRFENFEVGVTKNVSATCIYIRGIFGLHRGIDNCTLNTADNTGTMSVGLDISGAPGVYSRIHVERCTDGVLIGGRGDASQAANSRDSAGIIVEGVTGHSSVTNVVRLANAGEMHDVVVQGITKAVATNSLKDDVAGITLTDDYIGLYAIGGVPTSTRFSTSPNVTWKMASTFDTLHVTGTTTLDAGVSMSGGRVLVDATTAKVTIDGADGTVAAGSIGLAENGGALNLSSRNDVNIFLDNDNNGTTQQLAVYHDATAIGGTPLLQLTEAGRLAITGYPIDGVVSPAQITADQNDYAPTGEAVATWRLTTDASHNVTGIANGVAGRHLTLINAGSFNIVLQNENASSTAANRIITGTAADITLAPDDVVQLWYDGTTARWRVVSHY